MTDEPMTAKGIRLPNPLWQTIEAEAANLRMTRSDYLRRRLGMLFSCDVEVKKKHTSANYTDVTVEEIDGD